MRLRKYISLTKPGIVMGNAITGFGGFALASQGTLDWNLLGRMLLGLSLIVGAGSVLNNYMDRHHDRKMARTQNRPLARGTMSPTGALIYALFLLLVGSVTLFQINQLTMSLALAGFAVYVAFYSVIKYHTVHGTLIGSIAGAVPPVVGYCAVSDRLDAGAWILFLMLVLWQMPHFFAIAVYRLRDYTRAGVPVLPVVRGLRRTKVQMVLYILGFMTASFLLPYYHYVGRGYFIAMAVLGLVWLFLALRGFKSRNEGLWARRMFLYSLVVVMGFCLLIPFSNVG